MRMSVPPAMGLLHVVFRISVAPPLRKEEGGASLRDGLRSKREALGQPVAE
jgi:hypothetical protein